MAASCMGSWRVRRSGRRSRFCTLLRRGTETRRWIGEKSGEGRQKLTESSREIVDRGRDLYDKGRKIVDEAADVFEKGRKLVQG